MPAPSTGEKNTGAVVQEDGKAKVIDPLLASLTYWADQENIHVSEAALTSGLPLVQGRLTPELYVQAADRVGIRACVKEKALVDISALVLPVVLILEGNDAAILSSHRLDESGSAVYRLWLPALDEEQNWTHGELESKYSGYAIYASTDTHADARAGGLGMSDQRDKKAVWFWRTITKSWRIYRDVLVASLFINIFVLANPLFVMNVYDRVVPNAAISSLWAMAIGVLVLYAFDFLLKLLRSYFIEVAGKKSDVLLSDFIFRHVLGARFEHHPKSVGVFVSQLREFETVRNFITSSSITAFIDLPFVILFLVVIAYIGGPIVWVPVVLLPCAILYSWSVHLKLKGSVAKTFQSSSQKNATLVESISNLETLKTLNAEGLIQRKWNVAIGELSKWGLRSRLWSNSATFFSGYVQQLSSVFIVIVGVYLIAEKELTQGALIACVILGGRVLAPMTQVSGLLVQYYQSRLALDALEGIVTKPQEHGHSVKYLQSPRLSGQIEMRELTFQYPDETQTVLSGVSLKIEAGEKVGVIGRLGSGKSTLQKLLLGLYQPTAGNVLFDGVDSSQYDPVDIREQIGAMGQQTQLFYGSIRENIMMGRRGFDDAELLRVSELSGVSSWVDTHLQVYERNVSEGGEALSGGQRQSVALARALVGSPSILLLDEPTSAMDNTSEARFIEKFKADLVGKTLVLVTHKMSMLALVDRLVILDRGRVVADGPKAEVLEALKKGHLNAS